MSDQFSQDPEEQLPDWLKALHDKQGDEPLPEEPEASPEEDGGEDNASAPMDEQEEESMDWLTEIRERHLEDSEIEEEPEQPKIQAEAAEDELIAEPLEETRPQAAVSGEEDEEEAAGTLDPLVEDSAPVEQATSGRDSMDLDSLLPDLPAKEGSDPASESLGDEGKSIEEEAPESGTLDLGSLLPELSTEDIPEETEAQSSPTESAASEEPGALAPGELPSWLEALRPKDIPKPESQTPSPPETLPEATQAEEAFVEISETEKEMEPEEEEEEEPLAGLSGVIPIETEISQSGLSRKKKGRLRITRSQQIHRVTLENMFASERRAQEKSSPDSVRSLALTRWITSGALLLAILFALLGNTRDAPRPSLDSFPESAALDEIIEGLPPSAPVLIGFELQPALYGELKVVASAVVSHLLEREAQLIFISTQPTGPALVDKLMRDELSVVGGYLNLGYLSGSTAALRQFASRPREASSGSEVWQDASMSGINSISDFALILVISSDAEDARAWLEQIAPQSPDGIAIVTSAQAVPLLFPYLQGEAANLRGLVGGLSGAAYYEKLHGQEGAAGSYWEAYSYSLGVIVVVVLISALYGRFSPAEAVRALRREERDEDAAE